MRLDDLVIPNGAAVSNAVSLETYDSITALGPAALTNVVVLQISHNGTDWVGVTSAGAAVPVVALESVTLTAIHGAQIRALSAGNEGAERTIPVYASGPNQS